MERAGRKRRMLYRRQDDRPIEILAVAGGKEKKIWFVWVWSMI